MKLGYLYTVSEMTPWKENVNAETLAFLLSQTPIEFTPEIIRFDGFTEEILMKIREFDIIFNLCYGFKDVGQVEVAGWLEHNGISHTASTFDALVKAQDKSLLPSICGRLDLCTPSLWTQTDTLDDDVIYISKPRKGSCHRNITIESGKWMKSHLNTSTEDLIIQPYIMGREFSVAVIPSQGGKYHFALPPIEIKPKENADIYIAGQSFGATTKDFSPSIDESLSDGLMIAAEKLHKNIRLTGMSRTDFRVDHDHNIYVLDVNAMPNMDPVKSMMPAICKHHEVNISDLIRRIVDSVKYKGELQNKTLLSHELLS